MTMPAAIREACRNLARAGIGFTVLPTVPTEFAASRPGRTPKTRETPPFGAYETPRATVRGV